MSAGEILQITGPVFVLVAVGYVATRWLRLDNSTLTDYVVYLASPALIFSALSTGPLVVRDVALLTGALFFIVFGVGAALLGFAMLSGRRLGRLYLPAMFMNAGNMLLPLCLFAFGEEGLKTGVIIFVIVAVLQSSVGVVIASGKPSLIEMFRLPHIYAVVAALLLRAGEWTIPVFLSRALRLLGDTAIPLMVIALGMRLRTVRVDSWAGALWVSAARMVGGYLLGLCFVEFWQIEGVLRGCILLAAAMPAAVINFVFAEKYGGRADDVAAAVFVSTVCATVLIPLVLAFGI